MKRDTFFLFLLAFTFLILLASCRKDMPCIPFQFIGDWDVTRIHVITNKERDTLFHEENSFNIRFLDNNEGIYLRDSSKFTWFAQCHPNVLLISSELSNGASSNKFYSTQVFGIRLDTPQKVLLRYEETILDSILTNIDLKWHLEKK